MSPLNEHKDMIAITAYYRRESELAAKIQTLKRENAALEKLIIKEGYIITNFNGEMALCRDPWHQPKKEQP